MKQAPEKQTKQSKNEKNIGAKVLSAMLAKALNFLIKSLTTCLCTAREYIAKSREIRQRTTKKQQGRFKVIILTPNKI